MLKIFFSVILVACSSLLGYIKASSYRARTIELQSIIEMIKLLEIEITYRKEPLSKLFRNLSKERKCWFSECLIRCAEQLENRSSLSDAWKIAKVSSAGKCPLKKRDLALLDDLVSGLGKSDSEGQKKLLLPVMVRMDANLKDAAADEDRLGKMYIALCTAAGSIAVILLI